MLCELDKVFAFNKSLINCFHVTTELVAYQCYSISKLGFVTLPWKGLNGTSTAEVLRLGHSSATTIATRTRSLDNDIGRLWRIDLRALFSTSTTWSCNAFHIDFSLGFLYVSKKQVNVKNLVLYSTLMSGYIVGQLRHRRVEILFSHGIRSGDLQVVIVHMYVGLCTIVQQ